MNQETKQDNEIRITVITSRGKIKDLLVTISDQAEFNKLIHYSYVWNNYNNTLSVFQRKEKVLELKYTFNSDVQISDALKDVLSTLD